jgi:hypothetical protein
MCLRNYSFITCYTLHGMYVLSLFFLTFLLSRPTAQDLVGVSSRDLIKVNNINNFMLVHYLHKTDFQYSCLIPLFSLSNFPKTLF